MLARNYYPDKHSELINQKFKIKNNEFRRD